MDFQFNPLWHLRKIFFFSVLRRGGRPRGHVLLEFEMPSCSRSMASRNIRLDYFTKGSLWPRNEKLGQLTFEVVEQILKLRVFRRPFRFR